jgi:hypothetical protein
MSRVHNRRRHRIAKVKRAGVRRQQEVRAANVDATAKLMLDKKPAPAKGNGGVGEQELLQIARGLKLYEQKTIRVDPKRFRNRWAVMDCLDDHDLGRVSVNERLDGIFTLMKY